MKKTYETPSVEKIAFQYRDQVVAASGGFGGKCTGYYNNFGSTVGANDCFDHWEGNNT